MSTTTIILCKIVFVLFAGLLPRYTLCQCTATSALSGTSFTTQSLSGSSYNWNNSNNLASSDDNRTTAAAVVGVLSGTTNYERQQDLALPFPRKQQMINYLQYKNLLTVTNGNQYREV